MAVRSQPTTQLRGFSDLIGYRTMTRRKPASATRAQGDGRSFQDMVRPPYDQGRRQPLLVSRGVHVNRVRSCAVLLLLTSIAACGSSPSGGTPASSVSSSSSASAPATTSPGPVAADGNPVNGAAFCAFLKTVEPRLAGDGSATGAFADLSIELANWIGEHPAQKPRTGGDLDAASSASCPQTRAAILAVLGATSFAAKFGS
jgi:hypothetical protein